MRKKMVIGAAGVGVLLAGIVSAANLDVSAATGQTLAAGDVTVSGAKLTDVEFTLDATGKKLDKVSMTLTTPDGKKLVAARVAATVGSSTATAATDANGVAVVDVVDIAVEDVETIKVVVAS